MSEAHTRALGGATPTTLDRQARTVEVVALSGLAPAVRKAPAPDGTAEAWIEELDAAGASLARFIGGPVLKDHRPTTDNAVGVVDAAALAAGGRIVATVRFSTKPAADELMADVGGGIVRGVSLGYRVTKWQLAGRRDGLRVFRAIAWEPYELSFTPVPVDAGATVRSHEDHMTTTTTAAPADTPAQIITTPAPAGDTTTRAAVNAEIRSMARVAGLGQDWVDGQIDGDATVDAARAAAFAELTRRGGVTITTAAPITVGTDPSDPSAVRRSMSDALAARLCPGLVKPEGRAREFMGHRALDMVGELAVARGQRFNRFDQNALMERAIGAHSTGDFPLLLADAGNKILLAQYAAANPTYRLWAARRGFTDFKPHKFLRVGDFPAFKNLAESGEVNYGTMSENREQVSAAEFATGIILGRRALVNDDLSALSDFSSMIAIRTAADENRLVYGLLTTNPALSDGKALFHADHANKAAAGSAITVASVGAAVAALRKMKSLDGIPLNLAPRFLVVGPDKELEGRQVLASITPAKAGDTNPWAGMMELIVDANITGNGWYVMADPTMCPTVVYGYVAGSEGPQIKTETDFDSQAIKVRAGLDFGYGVIDFRGAHSNAGA
ncbi:MAG: Mu-like prophage major head subunit gpT family protein [Achromobacter sp.]|uniref:prohead protease/major capsid protein fusion protein n=1 Tax=Achromobacter sp. TaxID=134375 RepID=UPI00258BFDF0|nr:prohead protease/major capsid protein fusion protein [Achromobacter sp.]MCW0206009.1 Mu-like prophage major head subunit gpT family protein [Achromobacter sp.]